KPMAQQQGLQITAREARFLLDANKLELRGSPTLLHWQKPPARPGPPPDLVVKVIQVDWFPASGVLSAPGAVAGERRLGKGSKPQTITASGMEGNTEQRQLTLFAPVRFVDPSRDAVVNAQRTEVDLARETISSGAPFEARAGSSQAWGEAFVIDLQRSSGHVPRGCRLQQPAESLQAQQCSWNWQQRRFVASGDVELRRSAPQQITRSSSLAGRLGSGGEALFSTPGGRVQTTLKLPSKPQGKPAPRSAIAL
ncbi:MAG: LPS export ABC transporter periplasmic protein LptC, partial [Prochlorococcaceae cyanobacterium]